MKSMKTGFLSRAWRPALARRSWQPAAGAFLATLLALPVHAGIVIPDDPLTSGVRVAPNILFLLDDSGSMGSVSMPSCHEDREYSGAGTGCEDQWLLDTPQDRSYLNNTIYYDPSVPYEPWLKADGNPMSGGQDVTQVFRSWFQANSSGGRRDLRDNPEGVFYVPNPGVTNSTDHTDFMRYWVRNNGGSAQVVRAQVLASSTFTQSVGADSYGTSRAFNVPAGTVRLEVRIHGDTNDNGGNADLYVRRGTNAPTTGNYTERDTGPGSIQVVSIDDPATGSWRARVYNDGWRSVGTNVMTIIAFGSDVEVATPTGREQEEELANIATWYSYYRTRFKAAKGGASKAFGPLGNRVRVGYRTINNSANFLDIQVGKGDGRFIDAEDGSHTNRSDWYDRLQNAVTEGSTPLRTSLHDAGRYFQRTDNRGPYGPETGRDQFTCRQNFTILTTDGYWNGGGPSLGNVDGGSGPSHTGPNGQSYTYSATAPFRDRWSDTLADVAMYYWKNDLRHDLTNNVPSSSDNPAFWQHMVTFGISIGLAGTRGWRSVDVVPADADWADPMDREDSDRIDDLLHAAVNGRGTFVAASNPDQFTAGLQQALAAINRRTSSYSNVAVNSVSLDTDTQVFTASYVAGEWTGALASRSLSSGTTSWTSTLPAWSSRRIFTHNGSTGATFPTSTQQAALARGGGPANYQVTGAANANYLKGDQSLEGGGLGQLRQRTGLLGDIVNSSPAYVKDTNSIYVGANDGMLHAFSASTGRELFAYVPNLLNFGYLSELSRGDYQHRFFVDGPIVVTPRTLTPGRNILVGSLGRGGKGLFGLDVSNPAGFGAGNVLWERGDTPGGHMGLVLGKPVLGKVPGGQNAVIIGNGPNSSSDRAVLIVLDLATGNVIREIDTGAGSAAAPNGLFKPVGVFGPDGRTIQTAYAGDMLGNVWKFNLQTGTAIRLFNTGGQPITGGVTTAINPLTRQRWVFFGTGRFLTTGDAAPPHATQAMYGFVDEDTTFTRTHLTRRTMAITTGSSNGYPVRGFEASAPLPGGSKGWYVELPGSGERIVQDAQVASGFLITASMIPSNDGCGADGSGYINALDAFTGTSAPGGSFFDLGGDGSTGDDTIGDRPIGSVDLGVGMPTLPSVIRERLVVGGTAGESGGGGKGFEDTDRGPLGWDRVSWREIRRD